MKNVMKYAAMIMFIMIVSNMNSQGIQWLKKYEPVYSDIAPSPNGDLIVCSNTGNGSSTYDSYTLNCTVQRNTSISKISPTGSVTLIKNFTDTLISGTKIAVDKFGNIYCVGYYSGIATFDTFTLTTTPSNYSGFLFKMNSSGVIQWAQDVDYGLSNSIAMHTDQLGNVYFGGIFSSNLTVGSFSETAQGFADGYLAKFDASGSPQWLKKIGGPSEDYVRDFTIDSQGNIYATGDYSATCTFGQYFLNSFGSSDAYVCKLTGNGSFLWAKSFGGNSSSDRFNGITATAGNKLYIIGQSGSSISIGSSTVSGGFKDYIVKLDTAGNAIWATEFSGCCQASIKSVASDGSDVVYTIGYFLSNNMCFGSTTNTAACLNTSGTGRNGFISKLDGSGNYLWVKKIKTIPDIGNYFKIALDQWGKVFVTGNVSNSTVTALSVETFTTSGNSQSSYFMRIDPSVIGLDEYSSSDGINIYPNPIQNSGTISIKGIDNLNNKKAIISNLLGQNVFETDVKDSEISLANSNLSQGVYFLQVYSDSQIVLNRKIIIE